MSSKTRAGIKINYKTAFKNTRTSTRIKDETFETQIFCRTKMVKEKREKKKKKKKAHLLKTACRKLNLRNQKKKEKKSRKFKKEKPSNKFSRQN